VPEIPTFGGALFTANLKITGPLPPVELIVNGIDALPPESACSVVFGTELGSKVTPLGFDSIIAVTPTFPEAFPPNVCTSAVNVREDPGVTFGSGPAGVTLTSVTSAMRFESKTLCAMVAPRKMNCRIT
jgi:hypothetical protein